MRTCCLFGIVILICTSVIQAAENPEYRKWCEETFSGGSSVYESYKDIAFNIEYTPERPGCDYWQTPLDTCRSGTGDCEDVAILFISSLPSRQDNAEIAWGWKIDNRTGIARAHAWCQLAGKNGSKYIVEGCSRDWSGIILEDMELYRTNTVHKPVLVLKQVEMCKLMDIALEGSSAMMYAEMAHSHKPPRGVRIREKRMSSSFKPVWKNSVRSRTNNALGREILKIFTKLHGMFGRYEKQLLAERDIK